MLAGAGGALQLIDTPPVVSGLSDGEGPGRPLLHLLSQTDALVAVVDVTDDASTQGRTLFYELAAASVLPIAGPVATVLSRKGKGGLRFLGRTLDRDEEQAARALTEAAHVEHAEISVRTNFDAEQLSNQLEGDILLPVLLVATKAVSADDRGIEALRTNWPELPLLVTDAGNPASLTPLRSLLLEALGYISVHLLERAAADAPAVTVLVPLGSDVSAAATRGGDPARLKGARIWGASAAREGQSVSLRHMTHAGDRIFLRS